MEHFDLANLAVQSLAPNNVYLYDDVGLPSLMVRIPKFYLDEVIDGAPHTPHPAFIVQDTEIPEIYISKYQNMVYNNRAYSLPGVAPKTVFKPIDAYSYAENKGSGWHVMTNAEWAAIALWCVKNGTLPHGNSDNGRSYRYPHEHGVYVPVPSYTKHTLTGTGPVTWSHDHTIAGIYDLNGNYSDFVAGIYHKHGLIYIMPNNDAALGSQIDKTTSSDTWYTIDSDGSLVKTGGNPWRYRRSSSDDYHMMLSVNYSYDEGAAQSVFSEIAVSSGLTVPDILKNLVLYPASPKEAYGDLGGEAYIYITDSEPTYFTRGGCASEKSKCGIYRIGTGSKNDNVAMGNTTAFRTAYINI